MNDVTRQSALRSLEVARPLVARLDRSRNQEDQAADLIEAWRAVEAALRALVGGTTLTGPALIREARQRQLLSFEQANALAEFHAAQERAHNTGYVPTDGDMDAARSGFAMFDAGLRGSRDAPLAAPSLRPPAAAPVVADAPAVAGVSDSRPAGRWGRRGPWLALGALALAVIAASIVYATGHRGGGALDRGVAAYQRGQREAAVGEFNKAERDDPSDPLPHVYLSRMAREAGNLGVAGQEATLAVKADPASGTALREMGAYLMTVGNYDLAKNFYIRAIKADTTDRVAQGYLGCALVKLGRADEAARWLGRAGQGPWSNCTPPAGAGTAGPGAAVSVPPLNGAPRP